MIRPHFADYCAELDAQVDQILTEWLSVAVGQPWMSLPREERIDDLPELLTEILRSSLCTPKLLDAHRAKMDAAVRHGIRRRRQGFEPAWLFAGYRYIREAARRHFDKSALPQHVALDALMRVDIASTTASLASLRGFHHETYLELDQWAHTIEAAALESLELQPE